MINTLKGKITSLNKNQVCIETDLGIGFAVNTINSENLKLNESIKLFTYMHWNQEQGPSLYGFLKEEEKAIFELIISCSGIGPKMGISILSQVESGVFINAIQQESIKTLSSISGIGPKKAEQIIFQLKNKVSDLKNLDIINKSLSNHFEEVSQVLASLNYSRQEISSAFNYLNKNFDQQDFNFDELLRKSLSFLSKARI